MCVVLLKLFCYGVFNKKGFIFLFLFLIGEKGVMLHLWNSLVLVDQTDHVYARAPFSVWKAAWTLFPVLHVMTSSIANERRNKCSLAESAAAQNEVEGESLQQTPIVGHSRPLIC